MKKSTQIGPKNFYVIFTEKFPEKPGSKKWRLFWKMAVFFPFASLRTTFWVRKHENWVKNQNMTPPNFVLCIKNTLGGSQLVISIILRPFIGKMPIFPVKDVILAKKTSFLGSIASMTSFSRISQKSEIFRSQDHLRPVLDRGNKVEGG